MTVTRRLLVVAALGSLLVAAVAGSAVALDALPERLHDGVVGQPYEAELEAEEGCIPYTFKHDSGYMPPGLTVDATPTYSTGRIFGTPTAPGWYNFYIELTDICGSVPSQGEWSVFIHPPLVITTTSLPAATPGQPYSAKLTAQTGDASILEWSLVGGSLPAGLALRIDGTISGTTSAVGRYTLVVEAYDRNIRRTRKTLGLSVGSTLQAASATLPRGEVGVGYSAKLSANGGFTPYRWSVASRTLPAGLRVDAALGLIAGRPAVGGTFRPNFTVTDATGATATTAATLRIAAKLRIATAALSSAEVGSPYRRRVAVAGGVRPVRWAKAAGALPLGIRLDTRTGVLSGSPRTAGTYRFTLRATDAVGGTARKAFRLTVAA